MSDTNFSDRMEKLRTIRATHLGHLLLHSFQAYDRRVIRELRNRGYDEIGRAHSTAIRHLDFEGTRITEMASRAGITKQGMGQLVNDLVQLGYLREEVDPTDRRAKLIQFTDKGFDLFEDVVEIFRQIEADYIEIIGEDGMKELKRTLRKVLTELDERDEYEFPSIMD